MKIKNFAPHILTIVALVLFIVLSLASGSTEPSRQTGNSGNNGQGSGQSSSPSENSGNNGQGSGQSSSPSGTYFTGDGGRGIRLGILMPHSQGLNANQEYLSAMVQGVLVSDFSKFSSISVLDRVSLDRVIMETLDLTYEDDLDIVSLGHVAQVGHMLTGSIILTQTGFSLQLNITDTTPQANTVASYSGTCTAAELDDHTAIHRASLELLSQMNVQLTARSRNELGRASTPSNIDAQTALARGVTAQRQGMEVAALSFFLQASEADPSITEATTRLDTLTANITSGNMGSGVQNDMQWRNEWIERLRETEEFITQYLRTSPAFYLVYPSSSDQWEIEYEGTTLTFSMELHVMPEPSWFESINRLVRTVRRGLLATGRAEAWRLNWPAQTISRPSPFGDSNNTYPVVVEIFNALGNSLGRQTASLRFGWFIHNGYEVEGTIMPYIQFGSKLSFPRVSANDVSGDLVMRIVSINGRPAEANASQFGIRVLPQHEYDNNQSIINHGLHIDNFRQYTINFDGNSNRLTAYLGSATTIDIPWGATVLQERVLQNKGLISVTIPSSVLVIGSRVFGDNRLTGINIPESLTSIGGGAFADIQLTSVIIPDSVKYIGNWAFATENRLTSITIGADVTLDGSAVVDARPNAMGGTGTGFTNAYNNAGRRAGIYTRPNGNSTTWTRR